jgi:hypothetical protein
MAGRKRMDLASMTHACPPGHIWDPAAGQCIPIVKGGKLAKKETKGSTILTRA